MEASIPVLTAFPRHESGGSCRRQYRIVTALGGAGIKVLSVSGKPLFYGESAEHVEQRVLKLPVRKREARLFRIVFSISAFFFLPYFAVRRRARATLVVTPLLSLLAMLCRFVGAPVILFLNDVPWPTGDTTERFRLRRWFAEKRDTLGILAASHIVCQTNAMRLEVVKKLPSRARRIAVLHPPMNIPLPARSVGGGLDRAAFQRWLGEFAQRKRKVAERFGLSERRLFLVTVGELSTRKNVEVLVRAISASQVEPKLSLVICGDGPERESLVSIVAGLGLIDEIVFAGWIQDTAEVVAGCDLLVMPSQHVGTGALVREALGLGTGVIASDIADMREILQHEELLFTASHVQALAKKLEQVVGARGVLEQIRRLCHGLIPAEPERSEKHLIDFVSGVARR